MMPHPLHPAVVHLPIALAVLVPGFAIAGAWLVHRGTLPTRSWLLVVLLQALLVGSGWLALETGEQEGERVERVVAERHVDAHEEAAERFVLLAGIGLLASAAGLLPRRLGAAGRAVTAAATLGVLAAGVAVGHSGGALVYQYGAASAYVDATGGAGSGVAAPAADEH